MPRGIPATASETGEWIAVDPRESPLRPSFRSWPVRYLIGAGGQRPGVPIRERGTGARRRLAGKACRALDTFLGPFLAGCEPRFLRDKSCVGQLQFRTLAAARKLACRMSTMRTALMYFGSTSAPASAARIAAQALAFSRSTSRYSTARRVASVNAESRRCKEALRSDAH